MPIINYHLIQTFGFTSICDEEGLVGDLNKTALLTVLTQQY